MPAVRVAGDETLVPGDVDDVSFVAVIVLKGRVHDSPIRSPLF